VKGTINNRCSLANNFQLAPWPPQYIAALPLKYQGDSDSCKFLMCYETTIASSWGNSTTFAKSFIISHESAIANWYVRLQPRSITSWGQLKEKFLINFQGFQAEIRTVEDVLSYQQYKRETLSDFFRRFLHLKAQTPEVS
jgi:hypothetical protein